MQGLMVVISSRSALFLRSGWLSNNAPNFVVMFVYRGFNLPFYPLALSRKGYVSSTTNWTLLSQRDRGGAKWSTRLWVREFRVVFVQDVAWGRRTSCWQSLP